MRGFDQEFSREAQKERNRIALASELVDVDTWGNFPLVFTHNVRAARLGVTVVGCFETQNPSASVAHAGFQWAYGDAQNELRIIDIDGLTAGTQYTLRLRVDGSE